MSPRPSILFLCTGNACRSQMAEAILRDLAPDRFEALSAGSHPAGFVHPLAEQAMRRLNIPMSDQHSKSWDEFARTPVDVVITVCDAARDEPCPVWPGDPVTAHWSLPDPAGYTGSEEERLELALRVADRLRTKIEGLLELDWSLEPVALRDRLNFLGEI